MMAQQQTLTFKALGWLLTYPDAAVVGAVPDILAALRQEALLPRAEANGFRQMFAVIGDSENTGSIGLHVSLGFRQAGVLRSAGLKFGRWLDVVTMQKSLGAGDADVPA